MMKRATRFLHKSMRKLAVWFTIVSSAFLFMACPIVDPPGNKYYLDVSENKLSFPAEGGSCSVVIITEGKWSAISNCYNVYAHPKSGEGPALLTVTADFNRRQVPNKGYVEIRGEESFVPQELISVEQEGWPASVYPENIILSYEKGVVEKLYIITSGRWKIWTIPSYVSLSRTEGYGSSCIEVTTTIENTSNEDLSDVIFIDGENLSAIVTIIQKHK